MATGAAIATVAVAAYGVYESSNQASKNRSAMSEAGKSSAKASAYATNMQREMFDIAREDLEWARDMAPTGPAPGATQEMRDYKFSDAPTLGEFSHEGKDRGDFAFGEEETKPFEFEFNEDDEIYQWKKKETQRLVDQKMASWGNMGSTANLTRSTDAMMNLMSREVDEQYNRQWQSYSTNATEYGNRFSRAMGSFSANTAEDMNKFNRAIGEFATQESTKMKQFGMTNTQETQTYNKMASEQNIDTQNYWNASNTALGGSGQSAAAALTTGAGIANTTMQGQGMQNQITMQNAANQTAYASGLAQFGLNALGTGMQAYNTFGGGTQVQPTSTVPNSNPNQTQYGMGGV